MSRSRRQPYQRDFEECFDMLHRMDREEHDALLREAGILDEHGQLAARYRVDDVQADRVKPAATS